MLKALRTGPPAERDSTPRLRPAHKLILLLLLIILILVLANVVQGSMQTLLLKAFFVAFLSVLPGWIYLELPETKVRALYNEYVLNLYRLRLDHITNLPEPPRHSIFWDEWSATIPPELRESANRNSVYRLKFLAGTRQDSFSPVVVTTLLLSVIWTLILQPQLNRGALFSDDIAQVPFPRLPTEALTFGFLGSYTFVLQSTVRRFFQVDLKSRAYVNAISRIIFVSALVIALGLLPPFAQFNVIAFFLGFFPELGFTYLERAVTSMFRIAMPTGDEDKYPLSSLDGFNQFYRFRLIEEGIESMQNLATANLADLILDTRIPVPRLIDWIDQSLLYIRVPGWNREDFDSDRLALRRYGIRTATDLLDILKETESKAPHLYKGLLQLLNRSPDAEPNTVESLRWTLVNEANLWPVRHWKEYVRLGKVESPVSADAPMAEQLRT